MVPSGKHQLLILNINEGEYFLETLKVFSNKNLLYNILLVRFEEQQSQSAHKTFSDFLKSVFV